ncbi:uncharacterized protein Dwil_GK11309 [Drosophila willistoni]|uniref:Conserved oligomeric Golgi complex subunit 2 n=1 Tax=Drosophila willistoni TaxID=7260 RepID=B4NAU2_DROWI|nr:conserved oligomeric Golgi complex subunit 2 [Drosophila willistoni]EDW80906.1 uncharacterized protein Dwil_GK11309 [Drosophila willistoni]
MHELPKQSLALTSGSTSTAEKLCFDKNEFMKANFSVDEFLHKNRNAPSLEQLRDNLGLYLKGLRAAMIDLINEDYADFVNLSANLVGLDQSIEIIQRPLEQFRNEIESIHNLIDENVSQLRAQLEEKRQLREFKRSLQSLKTVYETTKKLQDLMDRKLSGEHPGQAVDLERAALDLIQLQFHEKHCDRHLKADQQAQIRQLEEQLHQQLRLFFNDALQQTRSSQNSEALERCLRIYITLDACSRAEKVFLDDVVAPYMSGIISEQQLQNSPQGLAGIYSKILNFISLHMTDLLRLTLYSDKLQGFNFVVHSFWSDVEMRLELHMNSIFAPGNSEVFYVKYKCTRDFLAKIEELLTSSGEHAVSLYRHHKQTKSFEARWNLPVYFQICFQEIAGNFEAKLEPLLQDETLEHANPCGYQLKPFNAAYSALTRCWSEGVYLPELLPKFYKLNVQIVLRLCRWISDTIQASKRSDFARPYTQHQLLIALHSDIRKLDGYLPELQQLIIQSVPSEKRTKVFKDVLAKTLLTLADALGAHLATIQDTLVQLLINECGSENVRQVNDLPRLYRKTNREVPTRCSGYVEQMLRPLKTFAKQHETQLGTLVVEHILAEVASNITKAYFNVVSEVLTSVQKTEESLRRLRNLKSGGAAAAQTNNSSAISDDDKIRMQLRVDVTTWRQELSQFNFQPNQIEKLQELSNTVEESLKPKD